MSKSPDSFIAQLTALLQLIQDRPVVLFFLLAVGALFVAHAAISRRK